jgi:hypothetical protein
MTEKIMVLDKEAIEAQTTAIGQIVKNALYKLGSELAEKGLNPMHLAIVVASSVGVYSTNIMDQSLCNGEIPNANALLDRLADEMKEYMMTLPGLTFERYDVEPKDGGLSS